MVPDHGGEEGVNTMLWIEDRTTNGAEPIDGELTKSGQFLCIGILGSVIKVDWKDIERVRQMDDGERIPETDRDIT